MLQKEKTQKPEKLHHGILTEAQSKKNVNQAYQDLVAATKKYQKLDAIGDKSDHKRDLHSLEVSYYINIGDHDTKEKIQNEYQESVESIEDQFDFYEKIQASIKIREEARIKYKQALKEHKRFYDPDPNDVF